MDPSSERPDLQDSSSWDAGAGSPEDAYRRSIEPSSISGGLVVETERPLPVFIHSSFRTSSTWIWAKFRQSPETLTYYEIFHDALETCDEAFVGSLDSTAWSSHHPSRAPYFLEFLPLLKPTGGVMGYDASMAFSRFIPENGLQGDLSLQEQIYLGTLVRQAYRGHQIPVLTCTRSLGRMSAIKRFMNVHNVLLHRNPFHQWASYSGQALSGNSYFLDTVESTLKACRHDVFLSRLADAFPKRSGTPQDEHTFILFILMHLYLYAHAVDAADLVIDATALAKDGDLRRSLESELSRLARSPIDLSDARLYFEISVVSVSDKARFIDTIEQFTKLIVATCPSERAAAFVRRLKDETLAEWDLHETFTRRSTGWHRQQVKAFQDEIEQRDGDKVLAEGAAASLTAERDGLAAQIGILTAAQATAEAVAASLTAERDGLVAQIGTLTAAQAAAEGAAASLTAERDGLVAQIGTLTAAQAAAEATAASLTAERDGLAAQIGTVTAAQAEAREINGSLTVERDGLAAAVAGLTAAQAAAEGTAAALTAERDGLAARVAELTAAQAVAEEINAALAGERDETMDRLSASSAEREAAAGTVKALVSERDWLAGRCAAMSTARDAADAAATVLARERDEHAMRASDIATDRDRLAAELMQIATARRDGRWRHILRPR